jgi:hypothetical protein
MPRGGRVLSSIDQSGKLTRKGLSQKALGAEVPDWRPVGSDCCFGFYGAMKRAARVGVGVPQLRW